MQVMENLSSIQARITDRRSSNDHPGWDDLTVLLERAEKVDHRGELLHQRIGEHLVIEVPTDLLGDAAPGDRVQGHVRVAGPGRILAAPQAVEQGHFAVHFNTRDANDGPPA